MTSTRTISRRFPDYGWAWPRGELDQLLHAAMDSDENAALAAARSWLAKNDIDIAPFRDHRLLVALVHRFGSGLKGDPAYPRLVGLQRMLWSRSRLALHETRPALKSMVEAGLPVLLIKGASRVARDPTLSKGRIAHDIDILVRPDHMAAAFDILWANGWQASAGVSPLYIKSHIGNMRSMNFYKGAYGDIDLHQLAYFPTQASKSDDVGLWSRSESASLADIPVSVPSRADQIAIAIAHGGLDAHTHSDWLVDCHAIIEGGAVDWDALLEILRLRRLEAPAAIALTYLSQEIGSAIPSSFLDPLLSSADRKPAARLPALLQGKPREDFTFASRLARGLAKQVRLRRRKPKRPSKTVTWRGRSRSSDGQSTADPILMAQIPLMEGAVGDCELEIAVELDLPPQRRRVEMELNTSTRHIARLRHRKLTRAARKTRLVFKGRARLNPADEELRVEARPSRHRRVWQDESDRQRYAPLSFTLLSVRVVTRDRHNRQQTLFLAQSMMGSRSETQRSIAGREFDR